MSINTILYRDYLPELTVLSKMLDEALAVWQLVPTAEERQVIESGLIKNFEEILAASRKIAEVSITDYPEYYSIQKERIYIERKVAASAAKLASVIELYLDYFNKSQIDLTDAVGGAKRCRQKLATLRIWDKAKDKWVITESFLNYDNLGNTHISEPLADVVTDTGYLTLPVKKTEHLTPLNIRVTGASNGTPGNSESEEIRTDNILPEYCVDKDPANWFEYERLDSGPCTLGLQVTFSSPEICNEVAIDGVNIGNSPNFKVQDISFLEPTGRITSIHDLVPPTVQKDFFTVKSVGGALSWKAAFPPIKVSAITFKFVQDHSYDISSFAADGRSIKRKRFAIALRSLSFKRNAFEKSGGINSVGVYVPHGMHSSSAYCDMWPTNKDLYKVAMNFSPDGGETWAKDLFDSSSTEGGAVLLGGEAFEAFWALELFRNEEAFSKASSFSNLAVIEEIGSLQETVSLLQSPAILQLPEKPSSNKIFAMQPMLCKKASDSRHAVPFGAASFIGSDGKKVFYLPFSLKEMGVDPNSLRVFVNGQEWARVLERNSGIPPEDGGLGWGTFFLNSSSDSIEVDPSNGVPANAFIGNTPLLAISFMLDEESLHFTQRSDGYYCKFKHLFDPDKSNITIKRLPNEPIRTSLVVPKDTTEILTGCKYIKSLSFFGVTPIEVENISALNPDSAQLQTYVDKVGGTLFLNKPVSANASLNIEHYSPITLENKNYKIWNTNCRPIGIILSDEAVSSEEKTDFLYSPIAEKQCPQKRLSIKSGNWESRPDPFANSKTVMTLSEDKIIEGSIRLSSSIFGYKNHPPPAEQKFIDGFSEFLGLKVMTNEATPSIEADAHGLVTFRLAAKKAFHSKLGLLFDEPSYKQFFSRVGKEFPSVAELKAAAAAGLPTPGPDGTVDYNNELHKAWHVQDDGYVTVFVGAGNSLPGGINMQYYYRDPSFDRKNKFSADYENGILYLSEELDVSEERSVSYKAVNYIASYSVCKEINEYNYEPSSGVISVRTENMSKINNRVKVLWAKGGKDTHLADLTDYFSPVVYRVGVRFQ